MTTDAIAMHGMHCMMLSVHGSGESIKACRAMMASNSGARFELIDHQVMTGRCPKNPTGYPSWRHTTSYPCKAGYKFYPHRLGYSTWQLLAVSEEPGFIPVMSETGLWRALRDPIFTTPLLRSWVPWLTDALAEAEMLFMLDSFHTNAGVLRCTTAELDEIVSRGLRDGHLLIERGDA